MKIENNTSHFLHFVITVFFFPWIIVWVLCYFKNEDKVNKPKPTMKKHKQKTYNNWPT